MSSSAERGHRSRSAHHQWPTIDEVMFDRADVEVDLLQHWRTVRAALPYATACAGHVLVMPRSTPTSTASRMPPTSS